MIDGNCIKHFMSILGTMAKLGKSCVFRITATHLYFIVKESQTISSSPLIWCTIEEVHFFSEYNMEGLNPVDNEIYLEFLAENVTKTLSALKVSTNAKSVKIKLTKKLSPCLTFEIDLVIFMLIIIQCTPHNYLILAFRSITFASSST